MITGAHSIIYSTDAEADRKFLRDVLMFATANPSFGASVVFRQQANSHADCRPTETLAGTPALP
jgi:hypothetical protein